MPESNDGPRPRAGSQPYLPPPPSPDQDLGALVRVPRNEPPPASLKKLMRGAGARSESLGQWRGVLLAGAAILVLLAAGIAAYLYP